MKNKKRLGEQKLTKRKTDLELLEILKGEIKRLGMEDKPSRTELQKHYNKEIMPHPNTYVNRFGTWQKALGMIGIEYSGNKASAESARGHASGQRYAATWSNMSKEDIVNAVLSDVHSKGIRGAAQYNKQRDKGSTPSLTTLRDLTGYKWSDIEVLYVDRYGETDFVPVRISWSNRTKEELIDAVIEEIERIGSDRYVDYEKNRIKEKTPSITTIFNQGSSWGEIKNIYKRRKAND